MFCKVWLRCPWREVLRETPPQASCAGKGRPTERLKLHAAMCESQESTNPSPASELSFKQILKLYAKENTPLVTSATNGEITDE